jgi:uncharacterized protein (DUF433 family)
MTINMVRPKKGKTPVCEIVGGEGYRYYPLGEHIVAAPGVCGGAPTFKYTRLEVAVILDLLAAGWTVDRLVREYAHSRLTAEAVREAILLAKRDFVRANTVARSAR